MRKVSVGMRADITLNVVPVSPVIANILADRAYWKQASQGLDSAQRFLKFQNQLLPVDLRPSAFRDNGGERHRHHRGHAHKRLQQEQRFVLRLADKWTKTKKRAPNGDA